MSETWAVNLALASYLWGWWPNLDLLEEVRRILALMWNFDFKFTARNAEV